MERKPKVGFIGLGIMGRPMAAHLFDAGYPLVVYDIRSEAMQPLLEMGAQAAISSWEVAQRSDVVITMLPDSPDVEAAVFGSDGLLAGALPGSLYADMSTIAPQTAIHIAEVLSEAGMRCVDAPVSGGETGAKNATLSIMVGGAVETLEALRPIFEVMGKTITHCGGPGAGQVVKACNQIQVALNFVGMSEALVLGAKAGVDPAIIIKVLSGGYAQTRVMDVRGPRLICGDFEPGFRSRLHYKDLKIVLDTACQMNISLPATALAQQLFSALLAAGGGDLDHSAIITVLETLSQVQARTQEK